jgi:hypothetical protein
MMVALYIIGSAFALLVLAGKLREARQEVHRTRRELAQVTWQRDAYARTAQAPVPAPGYASLAAGPADGRALPSAGTGGYPGRRPEQ